MNTAKIFWSGRSQAVRLPKEFRFDAQQVHIRKRGNTVILEPIPDNWAWLDTIAGKLDEDFLLALEEQPESQERSDVDRLFG